MYVYAVVGYLDCETEEKFNNVWRDLSENNISQYGVESKGLRPHITIADYDRLEKDAFIELFNKLYEDKLKVDICLNVLGTFINTGTLFIAPALSTELLDFHKSYHNYFKAFNDNVDSFYLPGRWSPHCTIASRLSEDNMIQAFKYCKNNISKIHCKLNEVALIEIKVNEDGIAIGSEVVFSKELK